MAQGDIEARRLADRERDRRQHTERLAAGLCVKCGRVPALPERTQCGPCAEKRLAADRARHARARAEGKPRRNSEASRQSDRERSRRRREARQAAGLCIRCGTRPPEQGRSMCEPCRDDRRQAKRVRRAERRAAGLCVKCAAPAPGGATWCSSCAGDRTARRQRNPEAAREADRRRYVERRARGDCTRCGKPAQGAAECQACRDAARARYSARRAAMVCVRCEAPTTGGAARCPLLFPGLFDDGFPGLFRVTGARISRTDWSLPEGEQGARVSDGRRRVKPLRGSSAPLRPFG